MVDVHTIRFLLYKLISKVFIALREILKIIAQYCFDNTVTSEHISFDGKVSFSSTLIFDIFEANVCFPN